MSSQLSHIKIQSYQIQSTTTLIRKTFKTTLTRYQPNITNKDTNLMLIRYWASATASGFPEIVIVRSVMPLSRSSQFEMRIMAPEICLISAIFVPPLPIIQPISSFGTVISCVCWFEFCWFRVLEVRSWDPASAARAECDCFEASF